MKNNYYSLLFMSVALSLVLSGCGKKTEDNNKVDTGKEVTYVYVDNSRVETYDEEEYPKPDIDYNLLDDIYTNLLVAKQRTDGESLAEKMIAVGNNLTVQEIDTIDKDYSVLNGLIDCYIESYNIGDYDNCDYLKDVLDSFYRNSIIGRDGLYNILIKCNIPEEYQTNIGTDDYGHIRDYAGCVYLDNGMRIRCVGLEDKLLGTDNDIVSVSEYFSNIGSIATSHYTYLGTKDDICYIVNDVGARDIISIKWKELLEEAATMYQVDSSTIQILLNEENEYEFRDNNGMVLGKLDYRQKTIVEEIYYIIDCLDLKETDALILDSYLKDLDNSNSMSYSK